MLSREANSIYWLGRYIERADNIARFLEVHAFLALDLGYEKDQMHWQPLLTALGDEAEFYKRYESLSERKVIAFLALDQDNVNSIMSSIHQARENARSVRSSLSSEAWEVINSLYYTIKKQRGKTYQLEKALPLFKEVKEASQLFHGVLQDTLSRNEAWHFLKLGQMMERADKTARLIDMKYLTLLAEGEDAGAAQDTVQWGAVLKSASAVEMYRKIYHRVHYKKALDFLMFQPDFPRSISFALSRVERMLKVLNDNKAPEAYALFERWQHQGKEELVISTLHTLIDELQRELNALDDVIFQRFFAITA